MGGYRTLRQSHCSARPRTRSTIADSSSSSGGPEARKQRLPPILSVERHYPSVVLANASVEANDRSLVRAYPFFERHNVTLMPTFRAIVRHNVSFVRPQRRMVA